MTAVPAVEMLPRSAHPPTSYMTSTAYSTGAAYSTGGADPEHDALVAQVKQAQKSDPQLKEAWGSYVEQYGGGTRDPSRHDTNFLRSALHFLQQGVAQQVPVAANQQYQVPVAANQPAANYGAPSMSMGKGAGRQAGGGGAAATTSAPPDPALVERVKAGRRDPTYKERWAQYVQTYGGGRRTRIDTPPNSSPPPSTSARTASSSPRRQGLPGGRGTTPTACSPPPRDRESTSGSGRQSR